MSVRGLKARRTGVTSQASRGARRAIYERLV